MRVDSNIDATTNMDNLKNFNVKNSSAPLICLAVIYGLYAIGLFTFHKLDNKNDKIHGAIYMSSNTMEHHAVPLS